MEQASVLKKRRFQLNKVQNQPSRRMLQVTTLIEPL